MVGLGGLEPPTSPLSGAFYAAICIVLSCGWTEIDAIGPKHFVALGPLILSALASRIPYEHRISIHNQTPEAVERLPCQAGVLFITLINNSSECINRSHSDLMHNNRSALRRFGKLLNKCHRPVSRSERRRAMVVLPGCRGVSFVLLESDLAERAERLTRYEHVFILTRQAKHFMPPSNQIFNNR